MESLKLLKIVQYTCCSRNKLSSICEVRTKRPTYWMKIKFFNEIQLFNSHLWIILPIMTLVLTYNSHGLVNIRSNSKLSDLILNSWRTFLWFTQNSNTLKDYLWVSSWGSFCIYELEQNNFVHTPQFIFVIYLIHDKVHVTRQKLWLLSKNARKIIKKKERLHWINTTHASN